jgi:alkylation response protein AidB-like acyl-CoA dehydrogenase
VHFAFDDEQDEIRRAARELLARRSPIERVREAAEARAYDPALWAELVELGWPGLAIPEAHGGVGLGLVELVAVLEQTGYAVAATPLLADVCAALVLDAAGSAEQRERWLPGIADGKHTATVATAGADGVALAAPDGEAAAVLLLVAPDGTVGLAAADGCAIAPRPSVDRTRRYARVAPGDGLEPLGDATAGLARAEVALSAELVGLAQRALDIAVAYVRDRRQFGHPVGAFQGVAHRCAEMLVLTETARSATYFAAWTADAAPEQLPAAAAMAKASAADAARRVAAMAIQAHGASGFTWEVDVHWIYKRAHATAGQLAPPEACRRRIAELAAARIRATEQVPA